MSETFVTITGNVASQPELRQSSGGVPVARFRLATTERRYDRGGDRWADGQTSFFTVWAWRALGENVTGSVALGEPVVVHGKLRVTERDEQGQGYGGASIDALVVGHDLGRGTSAFRRVYQARSDWPERRSGDPEAPSADAVAPYPPAVEPAPSRKRSTARAAAAGAPEPVTGARAAPTPVPA